MPALAEGGFIWDRGIIPIVKKRRLTASAIVLCLLIPLLTACGDDDPAGAPARAPHLLRFEPEQDVKVAKAASNVPSLGGADALDKGGDRLIQHDALDNG